MTEEKKNVRTKKRKKIEEHVDDGRPPAKSAKYRRPGYVKDNSPPDSD